MRIIYLTYNTITHIYIDCYIPGNTEEPVNLPKEFFLFISDKKRQFLATYVKTEELHTKGFQFKVAIFKDVHDLDNIITLKTDRISYNDKTSNFLKKLNSGDVISYTPSINKPTFKGIKHPLNLKIHTKAETEDDMTFFATLDCVEEKISERYGSQKKVRFKNIANLKGNICTKFTWTDLEPNTDNSSAIAEMYEGQEIVFRAKVVIKNKEGKKFVYLKDIHNIVPRDEYRNNYGAM